MAKIPKTKQRTTRHTGKVTLPTFDSNLVLVRLKGGRPKREPLLANEIAGTLLTETGRALGRPGIRRESVFHSRTGAAVSSYSVDPNDPSRIIRERADGKRTFGRLIGGHFRALAEK